MSINSLTELKSKLETEGCTRCSLGQQSNIKGCCISRGNLINPDKMIIGEAPGEQEDILREPFRGPAGKLLDTIFESVAWSTASWYVTNSVKCRPMAASVNRNIYYKSNRPPTNQEVHRCISFLDTEIKLIQPKIIVTLGKTATNALLCKNEIVSIGSVRGKFIKSKRYPDTIIFPMLHPSALLRDKGSERNRIYRKQTWDDIRLLKNTIDRG